jgi:Family of unknown function (DUF6445)
MKHAFLVVDDFYVEPERLRRRALRLPYARPSGVNYPGVAAHTPDDIRPVLERFSDLMGGLDIRATRDQGEFRITTASDTAMRTSLVHVDTPDFSAIVHLSKRPSEGTHFYRHKALALERVSAADNRRAKVRRAIEADTLDLRAWEHIFTIPMKFNRLVIFDGKYFHSGPQRLTGRTLAEGRMTQHFFFYRA